MFNYYFIIKPCNYARGKDIHIVSFDFDFTSYVQYLHIQKHLYRMKVSIQQTLTPLNSVLSMVCTVSKQNEGQHRVDFPPIEQFTVYGTMYSIYSIQYRNIYCIQNEGQHIVQTLPPQNSVLSMALYKYIYMETSIQTEGQHIVNFTPIEQCTVYGTTNCH